MTTRFTFTRLIALALVISGTKSLALTIDRASCERIKISRAADELRNALDWLPSMKSDGQASPYHLKLFKGGVSGAVYKNYIESRVKNIICISADEARDQNGQQTGGHFQNGTASISEKFFEGPSSPHSRLMLLNFLIHEATHSEVDHIECHNPKNREIIINECDADYRGANAVSAVFLYNVAKRCTNCLSNDRSSTLFDYETLFFEGLAQLDWLEGNDNDLLRRDAGFFNGK